LGSRHPCENGAHRWYIKTVSDLIWITLLHHPTFIQHSDTIGDYSCGGQIMGNEKHSHV
jgi:hypothetical protein